ncbi:uncharacterized protein LOC142887870 isoform X3 [Nelusetta ayraudi]|uniref:uncharacterized protein LOC142887870 isoform X3 n=1 Tax=Nelusetta ayraudi TaxID=303726 RepID=UPI003F719328
MQTVMSSNTSSCNGSHILQFQSPPYQTKSTQADEINSVCPRVRFDSLTLDELSEELGRRTKETQRLQDELENATKLTLERFGCMYSHHGSPGSPGQNCNFHHFGAPVESSADCAIHSTPSPTAIQPCASDVDGLGEVLDQRANATEEEFFENVKEVCLQPQTGSQHNKVHHQPAEETFCLDTAIIKLQTELHKVQTEKDVLSDLRLKDSREHVCQVGNMLSMCQELHHIKRARDQKLSLQKEEASALNGRVEGLEKNVKGLFLSLFCQDSQHGDNAVSNPNAVSACKKLSPAATLPEDTKNKTDGPSERPFLAAENLGSGDCCGALKQNQRMKELITSLGQEMALLTDKLTSSEISSVSLNHKVELLKEVAEKQTSLHKLHVSKLVLALSTCNDKVCCLEQQLVQAQSQLVDIEREKGQFLHQAAELQSRLRQVESCGNQRHDLQEDVRVLSGKLRATRKQLCREGEEKTSLQTLLKQKDKEELKFCELVGKKNKEVHVMQQQNQQHLARLEEVQKQRRTLHADKEALRLRLVDREKQIDALRSQMENSTQMAEQHRQSIDKLHRENNLLSNQLNHHKLEIQKLVTDLKQHKWDMAAAEQERRRLQASVTDHGRRLEEEQEKKQGITAQLELLRAKLLNLENEHTQLQELHVCVKEEHRGVVLKLRGQLRNAHCELEQVRASLRALQGADGRGLQTAMDMQEKMTARREEIDTLQGKIQQLEEAVEQLRQEKSQHCLEQQQQLQRLGLAKKEKRQLKDELEALRSKDQQLRDRIGQLEAILHKLSESFADCQDFLELQDQDFYRLKLQHALDLKELPARNVNKTPDVSPRFLAPPSALGAPLSSQRATDGPFTRQQDRTAQELRSLVRELREVLSENLRPHTVSNATGGSFCGRRSAPERAHRTALPDEAVAEKAVPRMRRKTWGSEPQSLKMVELKGDPVNSQPLGQNWLKQRPAHPVSPGHKSPVYALLTSDPHS